MRDGFKKFIKKIGSFLSNLIFPDRIKCIFCNKDISNFEEKPFCDECELEGFVNNKLRCEICAEPIDNEATVCDGCQKNKRYFKHAFCPFIYEGKVRNSILAFKDSNKRYLTKPFAQLIANEVMQSGVKIDLVTYVPLSKKKEKKRGFDQAKLLSSEIAKILKVECVCLFEKIKDIKMQKELSYSQRQENTKGMYKLLAEKFSKKQSVLIVDDIITTCATINECARLLAKRVDSVYVASIARNKLRKK